ncbi:MAG: hypothetical protein WAQ77_11165, partial [Candidatus Acidiferrum sp.]
GTPPVTHTYIQAIKQQTLHYLTRSVRRRAATSKRRCGKRKTDSGRLVAHSENTSVGTWPFSWSW